MKVGDIYKSNTSGLFEIIRIDSSKSVLVRFVATGYETICRFDTIRKGTIKDKLHPSVFGVGYIGDGNEITSINGVNTPAYKTWQRMLCRCYDESYLSKNPTYRGCSVCDEWHNFQSFAEWFNVHHKKTTGRSYHLDKDTLVSGNKVYSPETCLFMDGAANTSFSKRKPFSVVSPGGEIIHSINLQKFCAERGLNKSNMHKVIMGKHKSCKGWTRYVE